MKRCRAALLGLLLSGCSQTYSTVPSAAPASKYDFARWQGHTVAVRILDRRAERKDSEKVVQRLRADVVTALLRSGVRVLKAAEGGDRQVTLRLTFLESDLEMGSWNGCTRMSVDVSMDGADPGSPFDVSRCIEQSNLLGFATASEALDDSYRAALAEVITRLEELVAREPAAPSTPASGGSTTSL